MRNPELLRRTPSDFDFVCTESEFEEWFKNNAKKLQKTSDGVMKVYREGNKMIIEGSSNCEFELVQPGTSSQMLVELVELDSSSIPTKFGLIPNLDILFTIKSSHKYLKNSPHFWKNLLDYHMMKSAGAKVRPEYMEFLKLREKETYTYAHPKLNQTKKNFFSDDNIKYVYDHDTIHKSVALYDGIPAYTHYMKDGAEIQCDKKKFFSIDEKYRLAGVVEESAVLAIERSLVPHPGVWTPEFAWKFALSKVCTSITSGWFREYAYENAFKVLKLFPKNYWEKFQEDVKSGLVKKVEE